MGFDALAYGIPPTSLASIDPVQLLSLEVAARALTDAGYRDREFDRGAVSVIFGAEAGTDLAAAYGFRAMYPQTVGPLPEHLEETLPSLDRGLLPRACSPTSSPGGSPTGSTWAGVNYTVDAACASSLAAVDMACKELAAGTSDMVLCGGADFHNGINDYLLFAGVHALSPTGQCRSFDAEADGIALGEGVACVALKRLEDAERDGDRVYAVIDAVAGSSDGRSLGLTAPRPEGQRRALERAYRRAGISPAEVGMVEAHGTGTVVGDRTEITTLNDVFLEAGAEVGSISLGSVKSQIGHTKCAAGMAGLIKTALALHRGVRPPTLNLDHPNPGYEAATSPFVFDGGARPWSEGRRVAGVSAFGFGGTNFHAVLSAHRGGDVPDHGLEEWPSELFLFTGASDGQAVDAIHRLEGLLDTATDPGALRLRDLAATVAGWAGPRRAPPRRPCRWRWSPTISTTSAPSWPPPPGARRTPRPACSSGPPGRGPGRGPGMRRWREPPGPATWRSSTRDRGASDRGCSPTSSWPSPRSNVSSGWGRPGRSGCTRHGRSAPRRSRPRPTP